MKNINNKNKINNTKNLLLNMKQKIINLMVIFSLSIILGCSNTAQKKSVSLCNNQKDQKLQYSCYLEVIESAKSKKDASICKDIKIDIFKDGCYSEIAIEKKDISICKNIQSSEIKSGCYNILIHFMEEVPVSLCDGLEDGRGKDFCYFKSATTQKDISICEKIKDKGSDSYANCIIDVGIAKNDLSVCEKIQIEKERNRCYYTFAYSTDNFYICEKIDAQNDKNYCYNEYAFRKQDPNVCDKIIGNANSMKDNCYVISNQGTLPAFRTGQPDILVCSKIQNIFFKDSCYFDAIRENQDFSCEKVKEGNEKDVCFTVVATLKRDATLCDNVKDKVNKGRCYAKVIIEKQHIGEDSGKKEYVPVCTDVEDEYVRDACYFNYAVDKPDYLVCDKIKDETFRDDCLKFKSDQYKRFEEFGKILSNQT